jgi:ElaB/YqjD/DUF883 family membrane-anchored ribosome-binding protein
MTTAIDVLPGTAPQRPLQRRQVALGWYIGVDVLNAPTACRADRGVADRRVYYSTEIVLLGADSRTSTPSEPRGARKMAVPALRTRPTSEQIERIGVVLPRFSYGARVMAQSSRPGGGTDDFIDKGAQQFKKVADRVEGLAAGAAGQVREVSDRTGEVAGNFKGALDKSVRDQPIATLALAAAVGFVLGALWKS